MKNTFVKVLSFMMALTMIVGAFGAITVSAADCAHANRTAVGTVDATCVTVGFTKYVCNDCGEEFPDAVVPATGEHDYQVVPATGATCDEPAYKAYKACSVCKAEDPNNKKVIDTTINDGEKLGHLDTQTHTQVATCVEDGYTAPKCARCGRVDTDKKYDKVTAAHKYIYTVVTAPTACTAGSVQVTCSVCDYSAIIAQDEAKHVETTMPATSSDSKVPLAGTGCQYKYKSGKYCSVCYVVLSSTPNTDNKHDTVKLSTQDDYKGGEITSANLTAELANLGFAIGDKLEVQATCTTPGYVLMYCKECKVIVKTQLLINEGKGHKLVKVGDVYPTDDNAHHAEDKKQDWKCDNDVIDKNGDTVKCNHTETTVVKKATAHDYTGKYKDANDNNKEKDCVVVVAATCEDNGYTSHTCKLCFASYNDAVTYKTGHNYGAPVYVSGTCRTDDDADATKVVKYVQKCSNKDCDSEIPATTPEGKDKCNWVKVERDGTCMKEAYYEYECSVCKDTKDYDKTDVPTAGKNPANHVYTAKTVSGIKPIDNVSKLSCTTDQVDKYLCECKEVINITTATKTGHTKAGEANPKVECDVNGNGKIDAGENLAAVTATCKTKGVSAGEFCKNEGCTAVIKDPVVGALDPTNHEDKNPTPIDSGNKTCVAKAYTTKYYACCGIKHTIETGEVDSTFAGHKLVTVAAKAATCTEKGYEEHLKCEYCKTLFKKGATALSDKIDAPVATKTPGDDGQHKWAANPTAKTEEKCDATGKYSYYDCDDCDAIKLAHNNQVVVDDPATTDKNEIELAKVIPAHGTAYMGRYAYLNSKNGPTCTEGAWANITNDYICKKCVLDADKSTAEANKADGIYWELPLNHKNSTPYPQNAVNSDKYDCTKATYVVNICDDCDYTWVSGYTAAAHTAHNYDKSGDGKVDDKDYDATLSKDPTCTTAGVNVIKCQNGSCVAKIESAGAAATGHFLNTAGGKVAITNSCKNDAWKEFDGVACSGGCGLVISDKTIAHNYVVSVKAATCTEDGHTIEYCTDCNDIKSATTEDMKGHEKNPGAPIEVVNGVEKWSCPVCGEYWTKAVDAVIVETLSAEKIAAGEVVTYTYAVTGKETFSSYDVVIPYDAYGLVFVGVEANADLAGLYAFASAGEYYYYDEDSDSGYYYDGVGVSLVVEYDAEGNEQFVETSADTTTVLFTLTFVASKTASGDAYIGDQDLEIVALGDLNGDEIVTAADAQAIFKFIGTNNVAADVNADGIVNLADVAALATFAASAKTVKDYLVMVDEFDKLEDVVFALFEAGKLNDINGDRVVNISDAYYFIATMNEEFADAPYEMLGYVLGNNDITMEALVNYLNVMISANGGR